MTPEFTLRPAIDDDREFLFQLRRTALGAYLEQTYGPWDEAAERARFEERTRTSHYRIVEVDGVAAGCLGVAPGAEAHALHRVFLLPAFQRRGIGTALVALVVEEARTAGVPVRLRVLRVNPARRLYERLGFAVTGSSDTHVLMEHPAGGNR